MAVFAAECCSSANFFLQKVANVLPGLISGWKLKAYRYSYHDLKFPEITVTFSR
jgi:hypothetical protein